MEVYQIVLFCLIGWSITSILVNGSIFDGLRIYLAVKAPIFSKLLSCMQCSGFWVGILLGVLAINDFLIHPLGNMVVAETPWVHNIFAAISYGFLNSGISVLLNGVMIFFTFRDNED